jgi:hypothetical protein
MSSPKITEECSFDDSFTGIPCPLYDYYIVDPYVSTVKNQEANRVDRQSSYRNKNFGNKSMGNVIRDISGIVFGINSTYRDRPREFYGTI